MSDLVRMSVSIEKSLFDKLQELVDEHGYTNRSEFVRDLVRTRLVEEEWEEDAETVGTVTLVYDHHVRNLSERLTETQHHHHDNVLATTHVHLDHDICAEMILMRGRASAIRELADELGRQKGVLHSSLSLGSTGRSLT